MHAIMLLTSDTAMNTYHLDQSRFFVHFQDNGETAVILNCAESETVYYSIKHFGADVVAFLLKHPHCAFSDILKHVAPLYEGTPAQVEAELSKVLEKLSAHSIV